MRVRLNRPILSLWPYIWRAAFPLVLFGFAVSRRPPVLAMALGFTILLYLPPWKWPWLWRAAKAVRRFRTLATGRVILHYSPQLKNMRDMQTFLGRCEVELDRLKQLFGFPLRGRVVVYLFAHHQDIGKIFRSWHGGAALSPNAILIAEDNNAVEALRHELGHLFSSRWSRKVPPLLQEGLSVWLQKLKWGQASNNLVRKLLDDRRLKLPLMLQSRFFFADQHRHACYALAGSFTAFLMRRYGWAQYRKLFRRCYGVRFQSQFKKCFGISLEKAEWQWRNEITVMEVLNRRLGRDVCF